MKTNYYIRDRNDTLLIRILADDENQYSVWDYKEDLWGIKYSIDMIPKIKESLIHLTKDNYMQYTAHKIKGKYVTLSSIYCLTKLAIIFGLLPKLAKHCIDTYNINYVITTPDGDIYFNTNRGNLLNFLSENTTSLFMHKPANVFDLVNKQNISEVMRLLYIEIIKETNYEQD